MPDKKKPNHFNEKELRKFAVEIIDEDSLLLRCEQCGQIWSPNLGAGGRLPHGYWRCPNGCNAQ
jgi:hypothetical protein